MVDCQGVQHERSSSKLSEASLSNSPSSSSDFYQRISSDQQSKRPVKFLSHKTKFTSGEVMEFKVES
jgi:hypothetical protein